MRGWSRLTWCDSSVDGKWSFVEENEVVEGQENEKVEVEEKEEEQRQEVVEEENKDKKMNK